jgi:exosortase
MGISAYFIWLKLDKIKGITLQHALLPGSVMLAAGCALFYLGRSGAGIFLPVSSFLLLAGGSMLVLLGRGAFEEVSFPLFFLAAMIPLPSAAYDQNADWMRQAITWAAVTLVKLLGIPLYRDGCDIYLRDLHLCVDHGCSGIRVLISHLGYIIKNN